MVDRGHLKQIHYCESMLCERGFYCTTNCRCSIEELTETKGRHRDGCECKCRFIRIHNGLWGFVCSKKCDEFYSLDWNAIYAQCPDRLNKKGIPASICPDYKGCSNVNCKMAHLPGCRTVKLNKKAKKTLHYNKKRRR